MGGDDCFTGKLEALAKQCKEKPKDMIINVEVPLPFQPPTRQIYN